MKQLNLKLAPPTTTADIMLLTEQETELVRACRLTEGGEHMEKGSEFYSFATKVKSTKDVDNAYRKIKIKNADASHIICVYRLENPIGPYHQQAIDDGDHGMGRAALKVLKKKEAVNICVFIVRNYGMQHLGKRRLEIVEFLAERALQKHIAKAASAKKRGQRINSQSSITSALSVSTVYDSQDEEETVKISKDQDNTGEASKDE